MSTSKTSEVPKPIDLIDLWKRFVQVFERMWLLVLIPAVLMGSFMYLRARNSFVPMYESRAMFSVSSGYTADDIFSSTYYDSAAASQMAAAFPYMLNTDLMREQMMERLGKGYINGSISAYSQADTNLFSLVVRSDNAQDAYDVLVAVIDVFPQVATYMVEHPQMIVLEQPFVPQAPYNSLDGVGPAVKGGVLGAAAGVVAVFFIAMATTSVYSVDQLKDIINVPVLAVIPAIQLKKRRSKQNFIMPTANREISETVRGLCLKVGKAMAESRNRVVLVTSTLKGEGKTTIASNLAMEMAKTGKRVVLLDADLRSQSVAQRFNLENSKAGLLECLNNPSISVFDHLQQVPDTSLWVLSGQSASQRSYNIEHREIVRILNQLQSQFDYVVMDTAPCAMVSDTALLCYNAGYVLYVVRPEYARKTQIMDTVNDLYDRGVTVNGLVYNGAAVERSRYGYGYKYGYGYGYHYGYGYESKYGYGDDKNKRKVRK